MGEFGSILWPSTQAPIWGVNYSLQGSPDAEGVVLEQVRYRGESVFLKGSLPSLRVQYDNNACGPYKDPLNYDTARVRAGYGDRKVVTRTVTSGGLAALEIEAFYTIGSYRLIQRWTLRADGRISPRLFSAGLQCPTSHRHHVYWRFDFDISGAQRDQVFEYNTTTPDVGWGPGWHVKAYEIARVKNPASNRLWAVMDLPTKRGYFVIPGPGDGAADAFAPRDLWVLRYRAAEDRHGGQGSASDDGLAAYLDSEPVTNTDVVIWYCGHLGHHADPDAADEYHSVGPELVPFRW